MTNGFGGGADNLAEAFYTGEDEMMNGHAERENNLRTREEILLQRQSDVHTREEALARKEKQFKERWEESLATWEHHARERDEYVSEFNRMLQGMRERTARSREEAIKSEEDARAIWKQHLERLENLLLRVQAREEAITIREQEEAERKRKNDNNWNRGPIVSMFLLVSGLLLLIQIRAMFPLEDLDLVAGGFAILWVLNSTTLFGGVFGTSSTMKNFSRYVKRLIYMCFLLFVIYALYLMALPVNGASLSSTSLSSAPTDGRSIVLKIIAMVQDTFSWASAYARGNRVPNVSTSP